jgi:tRNA(adenine34) deaminase
MVAVAYRESDNVTSMWHTLSLPWQACIEQAWEAYCAGSVPIGACITGGDGRILARGRNRINERPGAAPPYLSGNRLSHAEVNALLALDESAIDAHTCVLYTTMEPCPLCVGALTMANIRCFHYAARDAWAGGADLVQVHRYVSSKGVTAIGPARLDLESVLMALHVAYQKATGGDRLDAVLAAWEATTPVGVRLGLRLHEGGVLARMAEQGWSAAQVVDDLSKRR